MMSIFKTVGERLRVLLLTDAALPFEIAEPWSKGFRLVQIDTAGAGIVVPPASIVSGMFSF